MSEAITESLNPATAAIDTLDSLEIVRLINQEDARVASAVEAELAQLLSDGGLASTWQSGGAVPGVGAEAIQLASESNPAHIGQQIAQAVYGGLRS